MGVVLGYGFLIILKRFVHRALVHNTLSKWNMLTEFTAQLIRRIKINVFFSSRVYEQLHSSTMSVTCLIRAGFLSVDLRGSSKWSHMTLSSFTVKRDNASVLTRSQMS